MSSTVQEELTKRTINNLAELIQRAELGDGLAQCTIRMERLTTPTAHIFTPSVKARQILRCWASAAGSTGDKTVAVPESTPGAGACAVDPNGNIEFAAADAVTVAEVLYIPVEGETITETIPVTAGGIAVFNNSRQAAQILTATLVAPAATPGAKTPVARGTAAAAVGAGGCSVNDTGLGIEFLPAEAGVACTANVTYIAFPGVGTGTQDGFQARLEAEVTPV